MSEEVAEMMMVYDEHLDHRSLSIEDILRSSTEESPDEMRISLEAVNDVVPYIGQRFATHDAAYEFYSYFAKCCGFSIRHHRTEGKDGVGKGLMRRYFVCHRAVKSSNDNRPQRNRKSSRCGCQAYMRISKTADFIEKNIRNLLQSIRKVDPEDESIDLLRMCRNIKDKDPNFKFEFTLDTNNGLENIAWLCHYL